MDYRLLPHALDRARKRGVTLDMLEDVLQKPDQIVAARKGRKVYPSKVALRGKTSLFRRYRQLCG